MTRRTSLVISAAVAAALGGSLLVAPAMSRADDPAPPVDSGQELVPGTDSAPVDEPPADSGEGLVAETDSAPVDDESVATSDTIPTDPGDIGTVTESGGEADAEGMGVSAEVSEPVDPSDFGDPNYVSGPDEGDPNANGNDEPPHTGT